MGGGGVGGGSMGARTPATIEGGTFSLTCFLNFGTR